MCYVICNKDNFDIRRISNTPVSDFYDNDYDVYTVENKTMSDLINGKQINIIFINAMEIWLDTATDTWYKVEEKPAYEFRYDIDNKNIISNFDKSKNMKQVIDMGAL